MHFPYVRRTKETRRSRWVTEGGFRLIPTLPVEINADRFRHHVKALQRRDRHTAAGRKFRMKLRRTRRARA